MGSFFSARISHYYLNCATKFVKYQIKQRRRLCGGLSVRAPSEMILWGPRPHKNFSCLSNNIHIYMYTHTYMSIYNVNCHSGPPRNLSKSAPLAVHVSLYFVACMSNSSCLLLLFFKLKKIRNKQILDNWFSCKGYQYYQGSLIQGNLRKVENPGKNLIAKFQGILERGGKKISQGFFFFF